MKKKATATSTADVVVQRENGVRRNGILSAGTTPKSKSNRPRVVVVVPPDIRAPHRRKKERERAALLYYIHFVRRAERGGGGGQLRYARRGARAGLCRLERL